MRLKGLVANSWSPVFAQIDLKNAFIYLIDGTTPTANEIEIKIGEGNLTYSERKTVEYTLDRGLLDEVREGDEVPVEVRLDVVWEYIRGALNTGAPPSFEDALKNIGNASAWVSSDPDACRPFALDLQVRYFPQPISCGDQEYITISDLRYEQLDHDLRAGTISMTGRANVTAATAVRSARSS